MKELKLFKKSDLLIIFAAAAAALFFIILNIFKSGDVLTAQVTKNGQTICTQQLSLLAEPKSLTIDGDIEVRVMFYPDGAAIVESQCEDRICVNTGKLTKAGDTAVCLPARVTLTLKGEKRSDQPDVVIG